MAFLDDIDKKLTNLGQGAIQKTREMTDSAKLSGALKNLEGQKKDVLADLGAISYRKLKESGEEAGPEESGIIARLDELETQIADLRGQIQRVKGVIFCLNCHAQICLLYTSGTGAGRFLGKLVRTLPDGGTDPVSYTHLQESLVRPV